MLSPAIFLDRDGTIIVDKNYLSDPDEIEFLDGALEGLRKMASLSFPLIVVSNQSGVGRGYFSFEQAVIVQQRLDEMLKKEGVAIAGWYMCPHAPGTNCSCRKPQPGMIRAASGDLGLDPARSFVVGDKHCDIDLAAAVGAAGILVTTGQGPGDADHASAVSAPVCRDLIEASEAIARCLSNAV